MRERERRGEKYRRTRRGEKERGKNRQKELRV